MPDEEKSDLALVIAGGPPGESEDVDSMSAGIEAAAGDAFEAVKAGDREGFVDAFMSAVRMVSPMPMDEE